MWWIARRGSCCGSRCRWRAHDERIHCSFRVMRPVNKNKLIARYRKRVGRSPAEFHVQRLLKKINVRALWQKGFCSRHPSFIFVDFYFPQPLKICLEIDGISHQSEKQKQRDKERDHYLQSIRRFQVVRISEEEALAFTPPKLERLIDSWARLSLLRVKQRSQLILNGGVP
mgnify:CR=1 FL=1